MTAPAIALVLYAVYLALAFGLRTWLHYRATGSSGFRGLSGAVGSAGWWGGVLFVVAVLAGFAAPLLQLLDVAEPVPWLDTTAVAVVGTVLAVGGIAATVAAQQGMGRSWRIGVDPGEATALVDGGLFGYVRNPIFTAMLATAAGLTLLAPNAVGLAAFAALLLAIELQVRAIEEPHLRRLHGDAYVDYTRRVGRFVPYVGRSTSGQS